jgi:hypothetical protein
MKPPLSSIFLFLTMLFCCPSCQTPTREQNPYKTLKAPDGSVQVEQESIYQGDDHYVKMWLRENQTNNRSLLNPSEDTPYAAGFRFTPNSQWLVRMQKIGAGWSTLLLYHREGNRFVPVKLRSEVDEYFFSRPESKGVNPEFSHREIVLVKGLEENYAWMGMRWPDSRYLVVSLSGGAGGPENAYVRAWRCVYDLQEGKFFVPDEFVKSNAKAIERRP